MGKRITVDESIIFEPGKKKLSANGKETIISGPSSLCFELLLERKGEVCLYEELFDYVWRRFNMEVSPPTLHQHIALLRKGLKEIGADSKVIRTVTKRGFSVAGDVEVIVEDFSHPVTQLDESKDKTLRENKNTLDDLDKKKHTTFSRLKFGVVLFIFLLSLITGFSFVSGLYFPDNSYVKYNFEEKCQCSFYVSKGMLLRKEQIINVLSDVDKSLVKGRYLYLSTNKNADRASLFICNAPLYSNNNSDCDSFYNIRNIR